MPDIAIIKGDSYAIRRPMWTYEFVDELNEPMNFAGMTILTTYKSKIMPMDVDAADTSAYITHKIVFGIDGVPTTQEGLFYVAPGMIEERFPSSLTKGLPSDLTLVSDVQITDANGEFFTFILNDTVTAVDSVTNREG